MVNQVHGPSEADGDMALPTGGNQPAGRSSQGNGRSTTKTKQDRRITLLERADLDSDTDDDEQIYSSAEFAKSIADQPDEFLQELRELIRQQRGLNIANADLTDQVADLTEKSTYLEAKITRKDHTIAQLTEGALQSNGG